MSHKFIIQLARQVLGVCIGHKIPPSLSLESKNNWWVYRRRGMAQLTYALRLWLNFIHYVRCKSPNDGGFLRNTLVGEVNNLAITSLLLGFEEDSCGGFWGWNSRDWCDLGFGLSGRSESRWKKNTEKKRKLEITWIQLKRIRVLSDEMIIFSLYHCS